MMIWLICEIIIIEINGVEHNVTTTSQEQVYVTTVSVVTSKTRWLKCNAEPDSITTEDAHKLAKVADS
jgi:hypothetical protein